MRFLLYMLFLLVISCKPIANTSAQKSIVQKKLEPQIGFYFFEAIKQTETTFQVNLTKQKIVKGKVKGYFEKKVPTEKWINGRWLVTFFNPNTQTPIQLQIPNPLIEEVEYVNEAGNFEKKTIHHNKKEFILRIPYTHSIKTITFEKLTIAKDSFKSTHINQITL